MMRVVSKRELLDAASHSVGCACCKKIVLVLSRIYKLCHLVICYGFPIHKFTLLYILNHFYFCNYMHTFLKHEPNGRPETLVDYHHTPLHSK